MSTLNDFFGAAEHTLLLIRQLVCYAGTFLRALFLPRAALAARLLAAESQLAACRLRIHQRKQLKPRFTQAFRFLWVVLSKSWSEWPKHVHLMQPATVKRWHTAAFRLYWRWRSRKKPGRPPIAKEMKDLILRLSRENPLWGAERIGDTLRLLGYDPPCDDSIRKNMAKPMNPREKSATWLPFLHNHLDVSWAIDFFTVVTANFSFLYVFVVFDHGRRRVIHLATTYNPTMQWVIQQLRESTAFGIQPRYLFRDNDAIYGHGVHAFLNRCNIEEVRTAFRSPWQNPCVERFIGTLRRELLDHVIVLNQRHLNGLLKEYIQEYYHVARPHRGLDGGTPLAQEQPVHIDGPSKLIAFPVCGGLHHRYERVAA